MNTWDELRTVFDKQIVSFGEIEITPAILLTAMLIFFLAYGYRGCCSACCGAVYLNR